MLSKGLRIQTALNSDLNTLVILVALSCNNNSFELLLHCCSETERRGCWCRRQVKTNYP